MAEEPQPPIREGLDPTSEDPATTETTAPADRKAAAALSSLESHGEDTSAQASKIKNIDQEALAKAISRLELSTGVKGGAEPSEKEKEFNERRRREREERERRNKIKVDPGDVGLLELDLSKTKATELLRAHEGDAVKAMRAFVTAPV
ncbi:MAG: hypothetical protein Q9201_003604 [Fulgogasparrea decipioides]